MLIKVVNQVWNVIVDLINKKKGWLWTTSVEMAAKCQLNVKKVTQNATSQCWPFKLILFGHFLSLPDQTHRWMQKATLKSGLLLFTVAKINNKINNG